MMINTHNPAQQEPQRHKKRSGTHRLILLQGRCFWNISVLLFLIIFLLVEEQSLFIAKAILLVSAADVVVDPTIEAKTSDNSNDFAAAATLLPTLVQSIVDTYRNIGLEHVNVQTLSWHRFASYQPDERFFLDRKRKRLLMKQERKTKGGVGDKNSSSAAYKESDEQLLQKQWLEMKTHIDTAAAEKKSGKKSSSEGKTETEDLSSIIWDKDDDIFSYFSTLLSGCSKTRNATLEESFHKDCWEYLHNLVDTPRCTTRLDSRYQCNGIRQDTDNNISVESMLRGHLENDTINIVIFGAGPVGLHLASAFAVLGTVAASLSQTYDIQLIPQIRIVVFEKRNVIPGFKQKYKRDWVTDIRLNYIDIWKQHRTSDIHAQSGVAKDADMLWLGEFYETIMHQDYKNVNLPIKVIESLTLLSLRSANAASRRNGSKDIVKFVYEDYDLYQHVLSDLPNTIEFDATGNILTRLSKDDVTQDTTEKNVVLRRWHPRVPWNYKTEEYPSLQTVWEDEFHTLDNYQAVVTIAHRYDEQLQNGDIVDNGNMLMYPVLPRTWNPSIFYFLKIADLGVTDQAQFETLEYLLSVMDAGWVMDTDEATINDPISTIPQPNPPDKYGLCNESCKDDNNSFDCTEWCHRAFFWPFDYRPDIDARMDVDHPGFGCSVLFLNLTPRQADIFRFLTNDLRKTNQREILFRSLPWMKILKQYDEHNVWGVNQLDKVLEFLWHYASGDDYPTIDLFELRPYIYRDPLYPPTVIPEPPPSHITAASPTDISGVESPPLKSVAANDVKTHVAAAENKDRSDIIKTTSATTIDTTAKARSRKTTSGDEQPEETSPHHPPRLRIGDAFFVGDPNRSTGLQNHIVLIKKLVEQLRETWYGPFENIYDTFDSGVANDEEEEGASNNDDTDYHDYDYHDYDEYDYDYEY